MAIQTDAEIEALARRLGDLIPPPASHSGWSVQNLFFHHPVVGMDMWSVELHGPIDIDLERHQYVGGKPFRTVRVRTEMIEQVESEDPEELVSIVEQWARALRLDKIRE